MSKKTKPWLSDAGKRHNLSDSLLAARSDLALPHTLCMWSNDWLAVCVRGRGTSASYTLPHGVVPPHSLPLLLLLSLTVHFLFSQQSDWSSVFTLSISEWSFWQESLLFSWTLWISLNFKRVCLPPGDTKSHKANGTEVQLSRVLDFTTEMIT